MAEQSFSLIPFLDGNIPDIIITGHIARHENQLTIRYLVSGDTGQVLLPAPSAQPTRKDELWKATCFEFFVARIGDPQYWEFNLSPSGDWNAYQIDAYRRVDFREETRIQALPFEFKYNDGSISVDAEIDLDGVIQSPVPIQVGITSVIQTRDHHETYWALLHPNPQADFHLRESFIIQL